MPVLERERTATANIIDGWRNTAPPQFIEELASLSHETRGIPDPYYFEITPTGELFSPTKHTKIKDEVKDKTSHLGQLEYQALLSIEQWAANNNEGVIVWISPPQTGVYSVSKIIVSEIEHQAGIKKLFNRAILLDFNEKQCMKLAWNLTSFSYNRPVFTSLDQVRATPLILDAKSKSWVNIFEKLIDDPALWIMVRDEEDRQLKKETLRQAAMVQKQFFASYRPVDYYGGRRLVYSDEAKMAVMHMIGDKSGSCPPRSSSRGMTAFQVVAGSAVTISISRGVVKSDSKGERTFPCPSCGYINERPYEGYVESCQNPSCPNPKAVCC